MAGLWLTAADDGESVGEADVLCESVGDGDGLGDVLGEPVPVLGLGLGEPGELDDDADGLAVVGAQVGVAEPDELPAGPGAPYVVVQLPGADEDDEDWVPAAPPGPPP